MVPSASHLVQRHALALQAEKLLYPCLARFLIFFNPCIPRVKSSTSRLVPFFKLEARLCRMRRHDEGSSYREEIRDVINSRSQPALACELVRLLAPSFSSRRQHSLRRPYTLFICEPLQIVQLSSSSYVVDPTTAEGAKEQVRTGPRHSTHRSPISITHK